jgi:hypothetical protein
MYFTLCQYLSSLVCYHQMIPHLMCWSLLMHMSSMCLHVFTQEVYPNPETFNPERFLKDGSLDKSVCDPTNFIFRFRWRYLFCFVITTYRFWQSWRSCPGRYIALVSNWTAAASLLATLQFSKHPDGDVVGPNFEGGLTVSVYTFYCQRIFINDWAIAGILLHSSA